MSYSRKVLLTFLRLFIATGILLITGAVTIQAYPPLFPWALALFDGQGVCRSGDVLSGAAVRQAFKREVETVEKQLHLVRKDDQGYELWAYPGGEYWIPAGSESSLPIILAQQEANEYGDATKGVQAGDVVLDCGAHVGIYTRKALAAGAKLIVAIEPAPANLECLRRNLQSEIAEGRVIIYPKGVWDKEEELPLYEEPDNSAADRFVAPTVTSVVKHVIPLTRIDTLARELGLPRVDFIKMDIKGATARALLGGAETIRTHKPRLVISTEEDFDSFEEIRSVVSGIHADYETECGSCSIRDLRVWPDVVFFR
jgi:FkbM family methyltransferase